ncbi:MAG: hypothetical protein IJC74_06365 [Clostridia bacterium]|nr:hypothetical protein [Clostridia bacterium]
MRTEKNYEFRKRISQVHRENIRNNTLEINDNEYELKDGLVVFLSPECGEVTYTAAKDFCDYLFVSMNVSASVKKGKPVNEDNFIYIKAGENSADFGNCAGKSGYRIDVSENIKICGFDERGAAQALYFLEDIMNLRKAPYIKKETVINKPLFSPRMVHSGYGLDDYPDEYLSAIAHQGRDAILIFVKDVDLTPYGYLDFNDLIRRSAKYGIDVYAYSYLKHAAYPEGEKGEAYYEANYGKLFKCCPGLKGVTLVGESMEFPSRDPHVTAELYENNTVNGIPTGKLSSGFYPCMDYVELVGMIAKVVRKYKEDADIVFWTYNWGGLPEEERIKLINALPEDITLQATFEMYHSYKIEDVTESCSDYTLSFAGPGEYFKSEAKAAKKKGIKLYSMTNTGGLTWDFGVIPYEPMPYQWIKRYKEMRNAAENYGLCGLMESHHYGFYPSIISKLSKLALMQNSKLPEEILIDILKDEYGEYCAGEVDEALKMWSEAITHYAPCNDDMYGPFRVGPSYPMCLDRVINVYSDPKALFGNCICVPGYFDGNSGRNTFYKVKCSISNLRIRRELDSITVMKDYMDKGIEIIEKIENKNEALEFLLNLGKFISHSINTTINLKKWYILKTKVRAEETREAILKGIDELEALARAEIENVKATIPVVEADSRLGWEPSMEYICDKEHLLWKISQVEFVINSELDRWRKSTLM